MHLKLVPGAPPVVSAIPNEQSINVSWMNLDCQDSHGNITMYEVHYVSSDFGDHVNQTLSTSGDETSIEIVGLEEFANYTLKVRAYTIVGPGPYGNLMNIMTLPGCKDICNVFCVCMCVTSICTEYFMT